MPAPASSPITILPRWRWFKPPLSPPRRDGSAGRLLAEENLPRVIGVAILAHLGNLVAVKADVEVVAIVVFLAVRRDGVRFGLNRAVVAFANDRVDSQTKSAGHHRLEPSHEIPEPFMPLHRRHPFHPGHDLPLEVVRDHGGEPCRVGVSELTEKFGG